MAEMVQLRHGTLKLPLLWMTVSALLLFWAPGLNGFVAGAVGGWRAGHVGRATLAALVSTVIVTAVLGLGYSAFDLSPNYLFAGMSLPVWAAVLFGSFLVGAIPAAFARRWGETHDLALAEAERLRSRGRLLY